MDWTALVRTTIMAPLTAALVACAVHAQPGASRWIRAGIDVDRPVWGLANGIMVGLWPGAIDGVGNGGPRGLLRIGYPLGEPRQHRLVNFVAVEPDVADGHWRGLSEIEPSASDGKPGKLFTAGPPEGGDAGETLYAGLLDHPPDSPDAERLRLRLEVETFANGAAPYLILTLRSDRPDEVMLQPYHRRDSRAIRQCVLTATMGNFARLRRAWLAEGALLESLQLWPQHRGGSFTGFHVVPGSELARTRDGSILVPLETDEAEPVTNWPYDPGNWWRWRYEQVTQYWRVAADEAGDDLCFAANGRATFYGTGMAIPGGVAFENTEIREAYRAGQAVCFGITGAAPVELLSK